MWKLRFKKFIDNPLTAVAFLQTHLFFRLIADRRSRAYESVHFLDPQETISEISSSDRSLIRVGDGTFGYLTGSSIYFNDWQFTYDRAFAKKLRQILIDGQDERILFCYPHRFILRSRAEFAANGGVDEWPIWIRMKAMLGRYIFPGKTYGDALCFHPRYNPAIDYGALKRYFATKHIVIITANVARFADIRLGKTTEFIDAPSSDAWQCYEALEQQALQIAKQDDWPQKDVLFMISAAEAAKVMVYDLTRAGYVAWDTGQFFDLAAKEIRALG